MVWLDHAAGAPGDLRVSGPMMLHQAYAQLGIASEVHSVELVIEDERTGRRVTYGRLDPYWEVDTFHGHCVLHLPRTRRSIDPAVGQFPEVKRSNLPLFGRTIVSGGEQEEVGEAWARGELPPYMMMVMERDDQRFFYTVVGDDFAQAVWQSPRAREDAERYHLAGVNLASHALALLRMPDVVDRVRQAQYPKLNALLDVVGDAPIVTDSSGNVHVTLNGRSLRLDEIPVPVEIGGAISETPTPVPHLVMNETKIQTALTEVETSVQLHASTPDELGGGPIPVVVFEPQTVVGATFPGLGRTSEVQVDSIVLSGFRHLSPDAGADIPRLPTWTVRQTVMGLELWDRGGIWARADVVPEDEWLRAAERHGRVLVVYGVLCGVQQGEGQPLTEQVRSALFRAACQKGFVAAATVAWR
jgi:hypothetical protein